MQTSSIGKYSSRSVTFTTLNKSSFSVLSMFLFDEYQDIPLRSGVITRITLSAVSMAFFDISSVSSFVQSTKIYPATSERADKRELIFSGVGVGKLNLFSPA